MAKQKSGKAVRVVLALLGIGLLLFCANTVGLYVLGDVTPAYEVVLTCSGTGNDSAVGTEYRFSVSYKYRVDGVQYEGLNTGLRGPRLGPRVDSTVHYYPFAPQISSLCAEAALTPGILIAGGFSLALILFAVIPRKKGKKTVPGTKKQAKKSQPNPERVTMAWLMENTEGYDDTLEEYYQNGWDKGDPSWKCACGKWNTSKFCESCGKQKP